MSRKYAGYGFEIDEAPLDIDRNELDENQVADVQAFESLNELPLDRKRQETDPGGFLRGPRDNRFESFVHSRFQKQGRRGFIDLPLDFVGRILFFGAVFC